MRGKLTSEDPHTEAGRTVQVSDVALLEVTSQAPKPTVTDVGLFRLRPLRVIFRIPVVEHPRTWRSALDEPPQEAVMTNGMS